MGMELTDLERLALIEFLEDIEQENATHLLKQMSEQKIDSNERSRLEERLFCCKYFLDKLK